MLDTFLDHVTKAACVAAFNRGEEEEQLVSAETMPENGSIIDFKTFAQENPEKLLRLLSNLRPEHQEMFIEYYLLEKSQNFLAEVHGVIQTRIWQTLRIIERAIGAIIVLGERPSILILKPILQLHSMDSTPHGSLATMIQRYAETQSYSRVAEEFKAPSPAIRKIFRPAIKKLTDSKDLSLVAIGCYLKSLTHQTSLTGSGRSKRYLERLERMRELHFAAPSPDGSALISHGSISTLGNTPWAMFEISSELRWNSLRPGIKKQIARLFGYKCAAQIFAPLGPSGELLFGYLMARTSNPDSVRLLTRLRGISEMASRYKDETSVDPVLVPDYEVQLMIKNAEPVKGFIAKKGDFVQILTGKAKGYCGTVKAPGVVQVEFPSGRKYVVDAQPGSVKALQVPRVLQCFWGERPALRVHAA